MSKRKNDEVKQDSEVIYSHNSLRAGAYGLSFFIVTIALFMVLSSLWMNSTQGLLVGFVLGGIVATVYLVILDARVEAIMAEQVERLRQQEENTLRTIAILNQILSGEKNKNDAEK